MGVSSTHGTLGATMGPPADMLYAVEPDGVATINPSPCNTAPFPATSSHGEVASDPTFYNTPTCMHDRPREKFSQSKDVFTEQSVPDGIR